MHAHKRSSFWTWIVGTLLTLVLYVLSIGPTAWLVVKSESAELASAWDLTYRPVTWGGGKSEAVGSVLWWYLALWVDVVSVGPSKPLG